RSADEIADAIEAVGGTIESGGRDNSFNIVVDVAQPDFAIGVDILADIMLNATFPKLEIEREKEVQIASIQEEDDKPTSVVRNLLRKEMFGDHPYALRRRGSIETVENLTREDLVAFRDRYLVANNGVIAIFGDVAAADVQQKFEAALGSMK